MASLRPAARLLSTFRPSRTAPPGLIRCASSLTTEAEAFAPEAPYQAEAISLIGQTPWHKDLVNGITLIGRLAAQPDLRVFSTGNKKARGRLAVSNSRDGESEWFNFEAWGDLGEAASRELTKGMQVHVTGRLRSNKYTNKEGQEAVFEYITVNQINRIDGDRGYEQPRYNQDSQGQVQAPWNQQQQYGQDLQPGTPLQPGTGFAQPDTPKLTAEEQWTDLFSNYTQYWDNRINKRNPRAPDFKHKDSGAALWIDSRDVPVFVEAELAKLPAPPPPRNPL